MSKSANIIEKKITVTTLDKIQMADKMVNKDSDSIVGVEAAHNYMNSLISQQIGPVKLSDNFNSKPLMINNSAESKNERTSKTNIVDNKYELGHLIGEGGFGRVFKARDLGTGQEVAIKCPKCPLGDLSLYSEIKIIAKIRQSNIDYSAFIVEIHGKISGSLVLEYMPYDLLTWWNIKMNEKPDALKLIKGVAIRMLEALNFLSGPAMNGDPIIHRDIKPANILVSHNGIPKLTDFGLAINFSQRSNSFVGTPSYIAPEICLQLDYDCSIDVWSLGITLMKCATDYNPFEAENYESQISAVLVVLGQPNSQLLQLSPCREKIYEKWTDLIEEYIVLPTGLFIEAPYTDDPQELDKFEDFIKKMLTYDPQDRIKPYEALQHCFLCQD